MSARQATPSTDDITTIIAPLCDLEGPLLPMLHALQDQYGLIPDAAVPVLAETLNIGRAEVHGVISFYHDFRTNPVGRHVIKICRSEACQAVDGGALGRRVLDLLGLDWGGTTANGAVTVEPVYCLGMCACAPALMVGKTVHGRVDEAKIETILQEVGA